MTVDHHALARAMASLATDRAAVFPFVADFGEHIARAVHFHLRTLGRADLAADADEVEGLVLDVAFLLADKAGSWAPGQATPWKWAERAVRSLVAGHVGHARVDVDANELEGVVLPPVDRSVDLDLDSAAAHVPALALYRDALANLPVRDLHREVHLQYRVQQGLGDPSPAVTVATHYGLSAANVRQIDCRIRRHLVALVTSEPRFAPLRAIPWLGLDAPSECSDTGRMAA